MWRIAQGARDGFGSVAAVAERELTTVARVEDVEPGSVTTVHAGEETIALARVGDEFYAVHGRCCHMQGPLGEGELEETCSPVPGTAGSTTSARARTSSTGRSASRPSTWWSRTATSKSLSDDLARGLDLIRAGSFFEAHEALEDAWRAAPDGERDFFQGLVHVAVAWYQAERGNRVGCERQLEKARRRLRPFAPSIAGSTSRWCSPRSTTPRSTVAAGSLLLVRPRL